MNLIAKVLVIAVAIIIVLAAARLVSSGQAKPVSSSQAASNVTQYLKTAYPGVVVNITNVSQSQYAGSWDIIADVVINSTKPCPSFYSYSFVYPKFGFVGQIDNTYATGCTTNEQNVTSPAVAITKASAIPQIQALRKAYSDYNINTAVSYLVQYQAYNGTATHTYNDVWLVSYSTPFTKNTINVVLTEQDGSILVVYNSSS